MIIGTRSTAIWRRTYRAGKICGGRGSVSVGVWPSIAIMRSFMYGAATRIRERCETLVERAKSGTLDDGSGTRNCLPACLSVYERSERRNQAFEETLGLHEIRSRTTYVDNAGYAGGEIAGGKVGLGREFQNNAPKMLGD